MQTTPNIPVELLRLYHLRDVVFPLAEQAEREERLTLNSFSDPETRTVHSCGTYGCLLGHAASTPKLRDDGWQFDGLGRPVWGKNPAHSVEDYYGVPDIYRAIFAGTYFSGSLQERKERLNAIIEERERELALAHG